MRKFLKVLLSFTLFNLVMIFLLSFVMKNYFQKDIFTNVIQESIVQNVDNAVDLTEEQEKKLNELLEDKEAKELMEGIVEEFTDTIFNNNDSEMSKETFDKFLDYIIENSDKIENIVGEKIDIQELEELKESEEVNQMIDNAIVSINSNINNQEDTSITKALNTYNYLTSKAFLSLILVLITVNIVLLALVSNRFEWIKTISEVIITSGFMMFLSLIIINIVLKELSKEVEFNITIDNMKVITFFITIIAVGIISLIIYKKMDKDIKNND